MIIHLTEDMATWVEGLFGKIVLSVENEEDLLRVYEEAKARGLPCSLITDAGRTEFKKECDTCIEGWLLEHLDEKDELLDPPKKVPCPICKGSGKVPNPTNTTVAIGPAKSADIDVITGPEGLVQTKLA